ncbi:MAG TPA: hypothetical protein VFI95_19500 [Terriglobales bacterium]|nr:hypothetical protein [Terriglobales bacterium]
MKFRPVLATTALVTFFVLCIASLSFAATAKVRGSSGNGENSNVQNWMLLGRSKYLTLSGNNKSVKWSTEIICLQQDVAVTDPNNTDPTLSGGCTSGIYMHLWQLQSTSANVTFTVSRLVNFTPTDPINNPQAPPNWGVMLCDANDPTTGNTIEMCTNLPQSSLPIITGSPMSQTPVTSFSFTIPSFPSVPAGTAQQGQGLVLFIVETQPSPLPLARPQIAVH